MLALPAPGRGPALTGVVLEFRDGRWRTVPVATAAGFTVNDRRRYAHTDHVHIETPWRR